MAVPGTPRVSVIINCLNGESFVRAAIDSVYAQSYTDWEIVFFDNASTDGTADIARSYDQKLRYFRNDTTVPLGQARNLALHQARGELIAFLDADDLWLPAKLEKQIPLFANAASVGLVFADTVMRYQELGRTTTYFAEHNYRPPRGRIFPALLSHYSIPMLTVVIRRDVLASMGEWFDERFHVCDDFDFCLRVAHDWECDYVDEPLASCLIHGAAATVRFRQRAAPERLLVLDKLRARHPDVDQRHGHEMRQMRRQIVYMLGKSHWHDGDGARARTELSPYLRHPKFLATYAATFLPYATADGLAGRVRRGMTALRAFARRSPRRAG